jgi:hypothetical protein
MDESPTPLYVRLAADQARRLNDAVSASGKSKRRLVEDAVREHLADDGIVVGRIALREDPPEVLTAAEAASLLRVDESQLLQAAQHCQLPGRMIAGAWRFSRSALLSWLGQVPAGDETRTETIGAVT